MRRALVPVTALAAVLIAAVGPTGPASAAPGPASAPEYWFDAWGVPALWAAGARGQGITIAELDTGVNAQLPELAANVLPGKDFGGSGDGRTDHALDPFGHGTAMASIMVAHPGTFGITGLAPDAKVLPVALPISGTDDANPGETLAPAIRYAVDSGAQIVNMSLGSARDPNADRLACTVDEQAAITYAISKGAVVVAASGNAGRTGSPVQDPAVCQGVISVGAVDATGTVAAFSSRHSFLTLDAPGVGIASLGRQRGSAYSGDGTSQAAAVTSAALALVWSKYPTLSGRDVVTRVLATLDKRNLAGAPHSPAYGYGTIDAHAAITAGVPADAANPVYAEVQPLVDRAVAASAATAAAAVPPPAARAAPAPPGQYAVGRRPGPDTAARVGGTVLAAGGLVLVLGGTVWLARGRRVTRPAAAPGSPG